MASGATADRQASGPADPGAAAPAGSPPASADAGATTPPPGAAPDFLQSDIMAGPGGVMTDEVGVITGELTLRTEVDDGGAVVVRVQYKDAEEWYVVTGARAHLNDPTDLSAVHTVVTGILNRPNG
ncbi:hypothetical protein Dfulv_45775 [Dactylosporangium fulvum]|uniref:Uncharacterized protein n=1 Tax=Dactylosporangium fulvum TaxID=53359 RepID=A0ABY5WDX7_9ACTN|nr:hypothetical protein [Dactylosporangium fulvum]UWP87721.1 hypothetical protein Dfulv_45775 [Dactylosporangium fulvum]